MNLILRWLLSALALVLAAELVPGIEVTGLYPALVAALVLGFLNVLIRPILIILTLPITILTLGLFTFVINALLFWFVASFIEGFVVKDFWSAFIGSLVVTIVVTISNRWTKPDKKETKVVYKEIRD